MYALNPVSIRLKWMPCMACRMVRTESKMIPSRAPLIVQFNAAAILRQILPPASLLFGLPFSGTISAIRSRCFRGNLPPRSAGHTTLPGLPRTSYPIVHAGTFNRFVASTLAMSLFFAHYRRQFVSGALSLLRTLGSAGGGDWARHLVCGDGELDAAVSGELGGGFLGRGWRMGWGRRGKVWGWHDGEEHQMVRRRNGVFDWLSLSREVWIQTMQWVVGRYAKRKNNGVMGGGGTGKQFRDRSRKSVSHSSTAGYQVRSCPDYWEVLLHMDLGPLGF